ncbi:agmatine deiminase family protein [Lewinella cohaerens]|uniref:agmatine deiminase family protein n=1 Tax=Lewinella cohaerens TaxID=70995 RepID=UPI0003A3DC13|nr:agmatine deiminase family protein [Lewinella cohaerens]
MTTTRRFPAEWEPQSMVQFTFPHADSDWAELLEEVTPCFVACVEAVSRFQKVLVVADDRKRVEGLLAHLPAERVQIIVCPSNDTWARDHGAITVIEDGRPLLLDFIFNGWGLKFAANRDNLITRTLHTWGIFGKTPMQQMRMVLEGGALETDGQGTLLSTTECLLSPNRNPHLSLAETEAELTLQLGVDRFLWLDNGFLAGDDTDSHIDTLARFCSPDTIAYVRCTDETDEHYTELKLMEQELQSFRTREGKPYNLVPLPWPTTCFAEDGHRLPATYANFLIINEAVLVPTYGVPEDGLALGIIQNCFPNREIIGIDCRLLIEQHGSLHCISMQYPAFVS